MIGRPAGPLVPTEADPVPGEIIVDAAFGRSATGWITSTGKLFVVGEDKKYGLGLGDVTSATTPQRVDVPGKVTHALLREGFGVALNDAGEVYSWGGHKETAVLGLDGETTRVPKRVQMERKIVELSAGDLHVIVRAEDGALLGWGKGKKGRLGLGGEGGAATPGRVRFAKPFEPMQKAASIKCGKHFSMGLTTEGELLGWGKDDKNQMGQPGARPEIQSFYTHPIGITLPEKVVAHACSDISILAMGESGTTYMWGGTFAYPRTMTAIKKRAKAVACGNRTFFVLVEGNDVLGWGKRKGLGLGSRWGSEYTPTSLPGLKDVGKIIKVVAGYDRGAAWVLV